MTVSVSHGGGGALHSRQRQRSSLEECEAVLYNPAEGVSGGQGSEEAAWKGRLGLMVSELLHCQSQILGSGCLLIRQGEDHGPFKGATAKYSAAK